MEVPALTEEFSTGAKNQAGGLTVLTAVFKVY